LCAVIELRECDGEPNDPSVRANSVVRADATEWDLSWCECSTLCACDEWCDNDDECGRARWSLENGYCALRLLSVSSRALFVEGEVADDVDFEDFEEEELRVGLSILESSSMADWIVEEAEDVRSLEFGRLDMPDHHAQT